MAFMKAVERELEGVEAFSVGACEGCETCREDSGDDEFSRAACDSCGTTKGGYRGPAHGILDGDLTHFVACRDCVMFHANGDLPEAWDG